MPVHTHGSPWPTACKPAWCIICHGDNGNAANSGRIPDLRRLPPEFYQHFNQIVLDGAMQNMGMVGFDDVLTERDAHDLKAFIVEQANLDWELHQQPPWWLAIKRWFYSIIAPVLAWLAQFQT